MSRVKIRLPENKVFETEITVMISDINYGNHLGNDRVLAYMQETRLRFFQSLGYRDELQIEAVGTIQADAMIEYRGEAFQGDTIKCELFIGEIGKRSIDFYYLLSHAGKGHPIAKGKTGIAFFDYAQSSTVAVPSGFLEKVK